MLAPDGSRCNSVRKDNLETTTQTPERSLTLTEWVNQAGNEITGMDPEQLQANYRNPHRHPGKQRDAIRASLDRFGFVIPIIVNKRTGTVIDGHMRTEEAISKGLAEVPVITVDIDESEEPALMVALGRIPELGAWDREAMADILTDLAGETVDIFVELAATAPTIDFGVTSTPPQLTPDASPATTTTAAPDSEERVTMVTEHSTADAWRSAGAPSLLDLVNCYVANCLR